MRLLLFCGLSFILIGCSGYSYRRKLLVEVTAGMAVNNTATKVYHMINDIAKSNEFICTGTSKNSNGTDCTWYVTRRNDVTMCVSENPLYVEMYTDKPVRLHDITCVQNSIVDALRQSGVTDGIKREELDIPRPIFDVK